MRTEITYENYTINKFDTLNWTLKKTEEDIGFLMLQTKMEKL